MYFICFLLYITSVKYVKEHKLNYHSPNLNKMSMSTLDALLEPYVVQPLA